MTSLAVRVQYGFRVLDAAALLVGGCAYLAAPLYAHDNLHAIFRDPHAPVFVLLCTLVPLGIYAIYVMWIFEFQRPQMVRALMASPDAPYWLDAIGRLRSDVHEGLMACVVGIFVGGGAFIWHSPGAAVTASIGYLGVRMLWRLCAHYVLVRTIYDEVHDSAAPHAE